MSAAVGDMKAVLFYFEIETLPHVFGFCKKAEWLRNVIHHEVRSLIANDLKKRINGKY